MGDSSGSAEKRASSKSKKSSARPRSSEGGSEQNSKDKTRSLARRRSLSREILQLKCNTYSLVSTGLSKSLAQQLHEHFRNKWDEEELERIPPPPKRKKKSTTGKFKTAQQEIQETEHVDTWNQQLDVKELAANVQNLTDTVMSLTKCKKSKKLPKKKQRRLQSLSISSAFSESETSSPSSSSDESGDSDGLAYLEKSTSQKNSPRKLFTVDFNVISKCKF